MMRLVDHAKPAHPSPWLDDAPPPRAPLRGGVHADIVIVGGGFTGLWTALALVQHDPSLRIVVVEAHQVGYGASGRNGGFVEPSLTHGLANGRKHFPGEIDELVRLGNANFQGLIDDVARFGIDCHLQQVGMLTVATEPWHLGELEEAASLHRAAGETVEVLDAAATRALVDSPTYLGGLHLPDGGATVEPGALVWGLTAAAEAHGVLVHEYSPATSVERHPLGVRVRCEHGEVTAEHAVIATNAMTHRLVRRTARHYVPVHDYALMTAPLTDEQLGRIGWQGRQGLADAGNRFHYYRLTHDNRILWGGFDAIYGFGNAVGQRHDQRKATHDLLERQFRQTFPQLADIAFERRWGGPIATTTRFTVTFGEVLDGRAVYALGYTGLGVAATRFAAQVLRDRLLVPDSPLLDLDLTSTHPFPFPPEPLRWLGVTATRRAIARADRRHGRPGPWLRLLDRFGIGFDS